jgi:signal transduction histidine kinase
MATISKLIVLVVLALKFVGPGNWAVAQPAGAGEAAGPQPLPLLTNLPAIRRLTTEEAALGFSVRVRGLVTWGHEGWNSFFLQDGDTAFYVDSDRPSSKMIAQPGDLVEVSGITTPGRFAPTIRSKEVKIVGQAALPEPEAVTYSQLVTGRKNCRWVELRGVVRSGMTNAKRPHQLVLALGDGRLRTFLFDLPQNAPPLESLVDSAVRVRGIAITFFNGKRQFISPALYINTVTDIIVEKPAEGDGYAIPTTLVRNLLGYATQESPEHRVKIRGTVTYRDSGKNICVRDEHQGVFVQTQKAMAVEPGEVVEVLGFVAPGTFNPVLEDAVFRSVGKAAIPKPQKVELESVFGGDWDAELVTLKARLLDTVSREKGSVLLMQAGDKYFSAQLDSASDKPLLASLRSGSLLELTGVCRIQDVLFPDNNGNRVAPNSFSLLLRSAQDVRVLQRAPWWTPARLLGLIGGLVLIALLAFAWVLMLRRRVRQQKESLRESLRRETVLEERTRIARELHDSLEQELTGLSLQLTTAANHFKQNPDQAWGNLETARRMLQHTKGEARRAVWQLRSQLLEQAGLAKAISETSTQIINGKGVRLQFEVNGPPRRLAAELENDLLRIAQEAVTNAIKHAQPEQILIHIDYGPENIRLRVQDDGCGFDAKHWADLGGGHFGLLGLHERAGKMGAALRVSSEAGEGTVIEVELPTGETRGADRKNSAAQQSRNAPAA